MEEEMYWEQHRRYDMEYFHRGPMGMMGPRGPFMGGPGPMVHACQLCCSVSVPSSASVLYSCVKRGCFESKGVNVLPVETLLHCTLEKLGRGLGLGNEVEWEI